LRPEFPAIAPKRCVLAVAPPPINPRPCRVYMTAENLAFIPTSLPTADCVQRSLVLRAFSFLPERIQA